MQPLTTKCPAQDARNWGLAQVACSSFTKLIGKSYSVSHCGLMLFERISEGSIRKAPVSMLAPLAKLSMSSPDGVDERL